MPLGRRLRASSEPDSDGTSPHLRSILTANEDLLAGTSLKGQNGIATPAEDSEQEVDSLVKKLYGVQGSGFGLEWSEICPARLKPISIDGNHALVLRYTEACSSTGDKNVDLHSIVIRSQGLKRAVKRVFEGYPGVATSTDEPEFEAPFHEFLHRWDLIDSEKDSAEDEICRQHIGALQEVLEEEIGDVVRDSRSLAKDGMTTFELLWTLFPPGCPVVAVLAKKPHLFLVRKSKYVKCKDAPPLFSLKLLGLDHDGQTIGWREKSDCICHFSGTESIAELDVVPLQFHADPTSVLETLNNRGLRALKVLCDGPTYNSHRGRIALGAGRELFAEGRIMIDPESFAQYADRFPDVSASIAPQGLQKLVPEHFTKKSTPHQASGTRMPLSDCLNRHPVLKAGSLRLSPIESINHCTQSQLIRHEWTRATFGIQPEAFCISSVRGYCLATKHWAEFDIDNVQAIQWNDNAFDALVMAPARKRILEALVKQQEGHKGDADLDDVVQGKGQGLIMLLTGPPGTGKTLTAESIADRLRLPLYAVSASELGDTVSEIEEHFGKVLRLAGLWNAVLLLDEADAFLEKRVDAPEARDRNKRVAAFLRILEYYRGILVLTTNRHVNFDDAFYSRIHLSFHFKALDSKARQGIWRNFVRGANIRDNELEMFAQEDLNGRQIKNLMKMARLLAKEDGVPLSAGHVREVLNVTNEDNETARDGPVA